MNLALGIVISSVVATPNFPGVVAGVTDRPAPECSLCHQGSQVRGTVTTPFGRAMRQRGLVAYDEQSLRAALGALGSVDSDRDGAPDFDELKAGSDPNTSAAAATLPEYGCSAMPGSSCWAWAACLCLARIRFSKRESSSGPARRSQRSGLGPRAALWSLRSPRELKRFRRACTAGPKGRPCGRMNLVTRHRTS